MHEITVSKDVTSGADDGVCQRGTRAACDVGCAEDLSPYSNYVEKEKRSKETEVRDEMPFGIDAETGERIRTLTDSRRSRVVRFLSPDETASPGVALIDALSFTIAYSGERDR